MRTGAKYIIVVPEGAAGEPVDDLDGLTALEAAQTPNLDALARDGRVGLVATTPPGSIPSEEVTLPCLLGYDPLRYPLGRAALDARGSGEPIDAGVTLSFRVDVLTVDASGEVLASPPALTLPQTRRLLDDLGNAIDDDGLRFTAIAPGVGLLLTAWEGEQSETVLHPVGSLPGRPLRRAQPTGRHAETIAAIMQQSRDLFEDHELNALRREADEPPITQVWIWGAADAQNEQPPTFAGLYNGVRGWLLADDLAAVGFARTIGWDSRHIGALEPAMLAKAMIAALDDYDVVCGVLHDAARASASGDVAAKVEAIERMDADLIAPLAATRSDHDRWRMLVSPSVRMRTDTGALDAEPLPFVLAGHGVSSIVERRFIEADAEASDLYAEVGSELMEYVLFGSGMRKHNP